MLKDVDLARVDLNLLVLFDVVAQEQHVGRAAQRMNLTPSAISHGLGRLRRLLNDPLFIRTPKGVFPTARALELGQPIAELLARARTVIATAEPFDPSRSRRRFAIGAPDAVSAVFLPGLLASLRAEAPGVDISVRQLLPVPGTTRAEQAWASAYADLEDRTLDVAVVPTAEVPARFRRRMLYEEGFVVVVRAGHPHARRLTLQRYCAMDHLLVSHAGDPSGFVDDVLARHGHSRRIALTVPDFASALCVVAETDLACAVPRRFAELHARRFELALWEPPFDLGTFALHAVAPEAALLDQGLAWLWDTIEHVTMAATAAPRKPRRSSQRH